RILIDTSAPAGSQQGSGAVWQNLLPQVITCLSEHTVYVLNRGSRISPLREGPIFQLDAPVFDFGNSVIEDRRLAALCRELEIDVFLSTYCTSAGAGVRSVFVAIDPLRATLSRSRQLRSSAIRAAKVASTRVALSN